MLFELALLLALLALVLGLLLTAGRGMANPLVITLPDGGQLLLQADLAHWQSSMLLLLEACSDLPPADFGPCCFLLSDAQHKRVLLALSQRDQCLYLQLLAAGWGSRRGQWLKIKNYADAVMIHLPLRTQVETSELLSRQQFILSRLATLSLQASSLAE